MGRSRPKILMVDESALFREAMKRLLAEGFGPIFQLAINSGKFQGTTAATTPSGSRRMREMASGPVGAISS